MLKNFELLVKRKGNLVSKLNAVLQDGLTGETEPVIVSTWSTPKRRWSNKLDKYVSCNQYRYGQIIMSTTSNLAKTLLSYDGHNCHRHPIVIKAENGGAGWVCSLGYKYKRTPRMKANIRFLEPLRYCDHLEETIEKTNEKEKQIKNSSRHQQ